MRPRIVAVLLLVTVAGCSSSTNSTNPSGTYFVTAKVDGVSWTASAASVAAGATNPLAGVYQISGSQTGTAPSTIVLSLNNIGKAGTFPLGVGATNFGGRGQISDAASGWTTPNTGNDGSIQLTALSATHIAGTFSFDAASQSGAATGTRHITSGQFDLPITGAAAGPGDTQGRSLSATIDGQAWNAVVADGALTNGALIVSATGGMIGIGGVSMTLTSVCAAADYALGTTGPARSVSVSDPTGTKVWSSAGSGGGGTVTLSSVTTTRITGSFKNVTLVPVFGGATGTRTITTGSFVLFQQTPPTCG